MIRLSLIILSVVCISRQIQFPSGIEKCSISDNKCILKSANEMLKKYINGYPDFGLVPLNPMILEVFKFIKKDGPVAIDYISENMNLYGLEKAQITKVQGFDKNFLEMQIKAPVFVFNGTYKTKAKLLGVSLNGDGPHIGIYKNFDMKLQFNLTKIQKNERDHFKISNSGMYYNFTESSVSMPDLGNFANWLINTSMQLLVDSLRDVTSEMWSMDFEEKLQKIFDMVPIDELFLK